MWRGDRWGQGTEGCVCVPGHGDCPPTLPGSYTEADERKIQHCFCYTSTVLTSTLAFQKEQKLKCECQVGVTRVSHARMCPPVSRRWLTGVPSCPRPGPAAGGQEPLHALG